METKTLKVQCSESFQKGKDYIAGQLHAHASSTDEAIQHLILSTYQKPKADGLGIGYYTLEMHVKPLQSLLDGQQLLGTRDIQYCALMVSYRAAGVKYCVAYYKARGWNVVPLNGALALANKGISLVQEAIKRVDTDWVDGEGPDGC